MPDATCIREPRIGIGAPLRIPPRWGMRRQFAGMAEVAGARDERLPKESAPNTIHHDTRRERVFRRGDGFGEILAAAAGFERLWIALGKNAEEAALGDFSGTLWISADENMEGGDRSIFHPVERVAIHFVGIRVFGFG